MNHIRTPEEQSKYNVQLIENRCKYFDGFMKRTCLAGEVFIVLNGGSNVNLLHNLPCNYELWNGSHGCSSVAYPTHEEALEQEARETNAVQVYVRKLTEHICPQCDQKWTGQKIGRCMYCEHCGYRLFQS